MKMVVIGESVYAVMEGFLCHCVLEELDTKDPAGSNWTQVDGFDLEPEVEEEIRKARAMLEGDEVLGALDRLAKPGAWDKELEGAREIIGRIYRRM